MKFYTISEFESMPLYAVDDVTYRRIEQAFISRLGERLGKKVLQKFLKKTLKEITSQSYVDVMALINIIG